MQEQGRGDGGRAGGWEGDLTLDEHSDDFQPPFIRLWTPRFKFPPSSLPPSFHAEETTISSSSSLLLLLLSTSSLLLLLGCTLLLHLNAYVSGACSLQFLPCQQTEQRRIAAI